MHIALFKHFLVRDIQNRFLGSWTGAGWALLHPVLMLMIYSFAFEYIFKARFPGVEPGGVLPYIAAGFWPWLAFSEALQRGVPAIEQNAGLLSKVALPTAVLVAAPVAASVLLHTVGFLLVCVGLKLFGYTVAISSLPIVLLLFVLVFVLSLGISWFLAAIQVFIRDVGQFLGQFLALMFFLTPILYAPDMLPLPYRDWLLQNPMTPVIVTVREYLLGMAVSGTGLLQSVAVAVVMLGVGWWVFHRLESRFEDFL